MPRSPLPSRMFLPLILMAAIWSPDIAIGAGDGATSAPAVPSTRVPLVFTGSVRDLREQPLSQVVVRFNFDDEGNSEPATAVSRDDGTYIVADPFRAGSATITSLSKDGYVTRNLGTFFGNNDTTGPFDAIYDGHFTDSVMTRPPGVLTGQVLDAAGRPAEGALVRVLSREVVPKELDGILPCPRLGSDGRFTFSHCPNSLLRIVVVRGWLYGEALAQSGEDVTIRLKTIPTDDDVRGIGHEAGTVQSDLPDFLPYWDYLGEDKMLDLAERACGMYTQPGENWPPPAGPGVEFWLSEISFRDPTRAAQDGPRLLARYDPDARWDDARAAIAGACALHPNARGVRYATHWLDQHAAAIPKYGVNYNETNWFRMTGIAMALQRPKAELYLRRGLEKANRDGQSSPVGDGSKTWGQVLAIGGEAALSALTGLHSHADQLNAWCGAAEAMARENPEEATWALTQAENLARLPDMVAYRHKFFLPAPDSARLALLDSAARRDEDDVLRVKTSFYPGLLVPIFQDLALAAMSRHDFPSARAAVLAGAAAGKGSPYEPYFASLASSFDAPVGRDLFARILPPGTADVAIKDSPSNLVDYIYYHSFIEPGESRLMLEECRNEVGKADLKFRDDLLQDNGYKANEDLRLQVALYPFDQSSPSSTAGDMYIDPGPANARWAAMAMSDRTQWPFLPPFVNESGYLR